MQDNLLTKSGLKERGWTESLIKSFLPEPDQIMRNPVFRKAAPMQLYSIDRVAEVEKLPEFQTAQQKALQKRQVGLQVADRRRSDTIASAKALPSPRLPALDREKLTARAVSHYNRLWEERGTDKFATIDSDLAFLRRISVNYVRHMLTDYERNLNALFGQIGKAEAITLVRKKVLQAIGEAYPWLAGEAKRQMGDS
jgi:hypothetical protein